MIRPTQRRCRPGPPPHEQARIRDLRHHVATVDAAAEPTPPWCRASRRTPIRPKLAPRTGSKTPPRGVSRAPHRVPATGRAASPARLQSRGRRAPQGPHRYPPMRCWITGTGCKIVVLELVDLVFGDAVSLGGYVLVRPSISCPCVCRRRRAMRRLLYGASPASP